MKIKLLRHFYLALVAAILFGGCATISPFDQYAYAQVTSVKVDVMNLMDLSAEPYSNHVTIVEDVTSKIMKVVEYEKHRPKNGITVAMWNKMFRVDSSGIVDATTMIPSFLKKWKQDGKESKFFIQQAKGQVSEGFDLIAELEASKIKAEDSKITRFLSPK